VLEAEQQLFPAQNQLAQTMRDQLLVVIQLYRALGGGWSLSDEQWMAGAGATSEGAPSPASATTPAVPVDQSGSDAAFDTPRLPSGHEPPHATSP
jgi:hypothetical protein